MTTLEHAVKEQFGHLMLELLNANTQITMLQEKVSKLEAELNAVRLPDKEKK